MTNDEKLELAKDVAKKIAEMAIEFSTYDETMMVGPDEVLRNFAATLLLGVEHAPEHETRRRLLGDD